MQFFLVCSSLFDYFVMNSFLFIYSFILYFAPLRCLPLSPLEEFQF